MGLLPDAADAEPRRSPRPERSRAERHTFPTIALLSFWFAKSPGAALIRAGVNDWGGVSPVTPDHVNFMARHARGVVSVALPERRMREMGIPLVASPQSELADEQAGSLVEARDGVTTGISAHDRAHTVKTAVAPKARPV